MLFDPKWEVPTETKADPFELGTLIDWLDQQPRDEKYDYYCNGECLMAQYFTAMGFEDVTMYASCFVHGRNVPSNMGEEECIKAGWTTKLPVGFDNIAHNSPRTFGYALARARFWALRGPHMTRFRARQR